ncbi:hypothetical protein CBR_g61261 [Chara braunii]|uniref:DUF676 domain-containing protein n=1 Tax=Chara braunii TaxID=69332 RepID=A0A388MFH5_CHABU|nr:hypothetical protein CBR_g61261 [Chara braunii]|eukprot:GBG93235.1 hypothetical protein CBR_g61261 [Chara braunii]
MRSVGSICAQGILGQINKIYYSIAPKRVPLQNVVLFVGDSGADIPDEVVQHLSRPEEMVSIVESKVGQKADVFVVCPSRYEGPFACYDHMLRGTTAAGDPLGYHGSDIKACRHIHALLSDVQLRVGADSNRSGDGLSRHQGKGGEQGENVTEEEAVEGPRRVPRTVVPRTILLGFSKGGVVLNQILAELAFLEDHPHSLVEVDNNPSGSERNSLAHLQLRDFVGSFEEFHYVDVGLNCRGAYMTDPRVLRSFAAGCRTRPRRLIMHGTPRQWCDRRRPWIAEEKERCLSILQEACADLQKAMSPTDNQRAYEGLKVEERWYSKGEKPNLRMHFRILESLELG